jgi:hypothetical protein
MSISRLQRPRRYEMPYSSNNDGNQSCLSLGSSPSNELPIPSSRYDCFSKTIASTIGAMQDACNCAKEPRSSSFLFAFGNVKFRFDQECPWQHNRCCKFYGIARKTKRNIKAQFPVNLAWLSGRLIIACIDFKIGTSSPGVSVRYRNVVPMSRSPVFKELMTLSYRIRQSRCNTEIIRGIESSERAILSLYKEKKTSPSDRDERGRSHTQVSTPPNLGILMTVNRKKDAYRNSHPYNCP